MKKTLILLALSSTVIAEQSTLDKFNALVMNTYQGSDEYFVNIPSKTFAEDKGEQEYLNDMYFVKAMNELHKKKIYQLRLRKSQVSDSGLNVLVKFPTIKELELSNSNITDNGIKKIVEFCPQLKALNIFSPKIFLVSILSFWIVGSSICKSFIPQALSFSLTCSILGLKLTCGISKKSAIRSNSTCV